MNQVRLVLYVFITQRGCVLSTRVHAHTVRVHSLQKPPWPFTATGPILEVLLCCIIRSCTFLNIFHMRAYAPHLMLDRSLSRVTVSQKCRRRNWSIEVSDILENVTIPIFVSRHIISSHEEMADIQRQVASAARSDAIDFDSHVDSDTAPSSSETPTSSSSTQVSDFASSFP